MASNTLTRQHSAHPAQTFSSYMAMPAVQRKINEIVKGERGNSFITSIVSAVSINPELAKCDHSTIFSAALQGEALKLSPSTQLGQYYLVPYEDKERGRIAQFQIGYKGYIQLAIRSGQYRKINVIAIKKGELKSYDRLEGEIELTPIADEEEWEKAETIGYYAMIELTNGFKKGLYWSVEKMKKHALQYSQAYKRDIKKGTSWSFWSKSFDDMAYKTLLRQIISKWGVMSIEMTTAINKDMAVINEDGTTDYIETDTFNNAKDANTKNENEENQKPENTENDPLADFRTDDTNEVS